MRLYLIRHGRTRASEEHLYCGSSDLPLTEGGRTALRELRGQLSYPALDGLDVRTSGMRRAVETFEILYSGGKSVLDANFREIDFGLFELHGYAELKARADYQAWIGDATGDACPPGGESANAFDARICRAADGLTRDSLIVCHGGVIAAMMRHWFPAEGKNLYEWQPDFGRGYALRIDPAGHSYERI